ncbi:unnamed protein product [Closterium sp. NIES-54]
MAHRAGGHTPPATVVQMDAVQGRGLAGAAGHAATQEAAALGSAVGAVGQQQQVQAPVATGNPVVSAVQAVVGRAKALIDKLPRHEVSEMQALGGHCSSLPVRSLPAYPPSLHADPCTACLHLLLTHLLATQPPSPPLHQPNEEETQLFDVLWLLLASVVFVPIFQKLPGGTHTPARLPCRRPCCHPCCRPCCHPLMLSCPTSLPHTSLPPTSLSQHHRQPRAGILGSSPVLGYLAAGALIGPYALSIIKHVHGTKALAEFGVVFLMFNIGLELSLERLRSMRKYVFGLGSAQVLVSALAIGLCVLAVARVSGPAAIVIGNGLALSSTAVVLQVLQERGESTSRHGRATFSVLLFQDLAVVVLLILIPLLSPNSSGGGVGFKAIAEALGVAAVKAVIAIAGIIAGGRLLLRPIYRSMAENHNAEIFAANTLLVVLGTSVLTARAGLSMALGAFLAGLLLSETEFALQVESDINPYRGLLLGLFFMTVGMSIDPKLLVARFPLILAALAVLIVGKTALLAGMGRLFGLSPVAAVRTGLLLAPGGEFAFVAFGEAVSKGIMSAQLCSLLFIVVGLSMAITPWLAAVGQLIASRFDQQDVRSLQPHEAETDDLQGHIIICGFGRVGQIIGQLLSERLIPFVALDVSSDRVSAGRSLDLPVYFGDAGSRDVLHKVGAERAAAAVITLDTPGANYRAVWALSKSFPHVKTFVRAHDVTHGINLEKAGATAVVPETLEPSLQLAAAVLAQVGPAARCRCARLGTWAEVTLVPRQHDVTHGMNLKKAGATAVVPEALEPSLQLAAAVLAQMNGAATTSLPPLISSPIPPVSPSHLRSSLPPFTSMPVPPGEAASSRDSRHAGRLQNTTPGRADGGNADSCCRSASLDCRLGPQGRNLAPAHSSALVAIPPSGARAYRATVAAPRGPQQSSEAARSIACIVCTPTTADTCRARSDPHSPSLSPALPSAVPPALPPALFHPCRSPSPPLRSAARARRIVALVAPFFVPRPSAQAESPPSASTAQHSLSPSSPISPNALSPPLPSSAPARTPGAEAQGGCAGGRGCAAGAGAAAAVRCVLGARAALRARCGALGMCTVLWACVRCCEYVCGAVGMCAVLWVCVRCCEYVWCCRDVCEHYCSNPSCCYLFSLLPPRPSHSSLLSHLSSLIYHFSSLLSPLSSLFSPLLFQVASLSWRHQQLASALANSNAAAGAAGGSGASGGGSGAAAAAAAAGDGAAKEAEKEMNPANPMHLHGMAHALSMLSAECRLLNVQNMSNLISPPQSSLLPLPPSQTVRKRRKAKPTDLINQRRWQQFYRNIVLIVNYKRPQQMPVTLDLLHSLYGSLFQRILAVSEFGDADLGVLEGHDLPSLCSRNFTHSPPSYIPLHNSFLPPHHSESDNALRLLLPACLLFQSPVKETGHGHDLPPGSLHYSVLPKLLTWHPMAEGFLWMDDDTVLNYWTMSRDNKVR